MNEYEKMSKQRVLFQFGGSYDNDPELTSVETMYLPLGLKKDMVEAVVETIVRQFADARNFRTYTYRIVEINQVNVVVEYK